jgi:hypothetical protein
MTRPDSNSSDQSANQDDAVWLDLVARLEGSPGDAPEAGSGDSKAHRPFRDFDPLGLSGAAPTELSAAERRSSQPGPLPQDGGPETASGPRDYDADDDDGGFVPEEPPSLAGVDPLTMLAWIGAVGAPVALLLSVMFWRSAPLMAVLGIVTAFVVSVIYLIMQLPQEKDDHDDGARI